MNRVVPGAAVLLFCVSCAAAEGAELVNEKLVLKRDSSYVSAADERKLTGRWPAVLSPDGTKLFYLDYETPKKKDSGEKLYRAYIRDLKTGRDIPLPAPAVTDDRPLLSMMNLKIFSASGRRVAFGVGEDANKDGTSDYSSGTDRMRAILYDIPSGKVIDLGMSATVLIPSIDSKGRGLIVVKADMENQEMKGRLIVRLSGEKETWSFSTWGLPGMVCPTSDLLPLLLPADQGEKNEQEFILYDVKAGKKYASLPTTSPLFGIDGVDVHWTSNGRYMYYFDIKPEVPETNSPSIAFTRIYDRVARKQFIAIAGFAVGPGPGYTIMVVAGEKKDGSCDVVLYDTATKKGRPLARGIRPIRANGKYLLYTKPTSRRTEDIYAAEIVVPAAATGVRK